MDGPIPAQKEPYGVNVEAGKIFNLKVTLAVASAATQVEVSANSIAIETSSSALTSVIPTKAITDIPLNGRDFTQLLKLNPGVNAGVYPVGMRTGGDPCRHHRRRRRCHRVEMQRS